MRLVPGSPDPAISLAAPAASTVVEPAPAEDEILIGGHVHRKSAKASNYRTVVTSRVDGVISKQGIYDVVNTIRIDNVPRPGRVRRHDRAVSESRGDRARAGGNNLVVPGTKRKNIVPGRVDSVIAARRRYMLVPDTLSVPPIVPVTRTTFVPLKVSDVASATPT